jgi:hypothetical protein
MFYTHCSDTASEPPMKTAREHPETAEVTFDTVLARLAVAFTAVAFGAPALLALLR